MSVSKTFSLVEGTKLSNVVETAKQSLCGQGFEVSAQVLNENSATMTVSKDRDGLKNIIGLGVESTVTISVINENTLSVNIEDVWTNKILAIAIGWFVCFVPCITGIIGCSNQSGLKNKISNAMMLGANTKSE